MRTCLADKPPEDPAPRSEASTPHAEGTSPSLRDGTLYEPPLPSSAATAT